MPEFWGNDANETFDSIECKFKSLLQSHVFFVIKV